MRGLPLALVSTLLCTGVPFAGSSVRAADWSTDIGLFTAIVAGAHVSSGVAPESGVVPGAALEITQRFERVRVRLEAIPTVAAASSSRGVFGSNSASLALLNATALVDLDARRRFRIGAGFQIVDLTNQSGRDGVRNAVRVTTPIYTAAATLPLPRTQFVELSVMADPNVRAMLHAVDRFGSMLPDTPEIGAEVDYAAAYGFRRGDVTYVLGARGLSYHTRDATSGRLVDRNVGAGATFEARFALGHRAGR